MTKPRMTIIGFGVMGKRFAKIFENGFDVGISSSRDVAEEAAGIGAHLVQDFGEAIANSDYIFIAAPIHALDSVISRVNETVRPDACAFDMCSARVVAAKKMSALKCKWFGLHSRGLFGEAPTEITDYLAEREHRFEPMAAEEHDKIGSVVAMIHFLGMALESILSDADRQILATSPAATNFLKLIDHLRNNAPDTYWESQICNAFTAGQRKQLIEGLVEYAGKLDRGLFPFSERLLGVKYE